MANSFAELEQLIRQKVNESLKEEVVPKLVNKTKDNVDKIVYNVVNPNSYERTYQLRESIIGKVNSKGKDYIELNIFNDIN